MDEKRILYFVLGVLSVVSVGAVAIRDDGIQFPDGSVQMSATGVGLKRAYLTAAAVTGDQATTACASGYHMASISEVFVLSGREYAADAPGALVTADRGDGFVMGVFGWIRTGGPAGSDIFATNPIINCEAWTSTAGYGQRALANTSGANVLLGGIPPLDDNLCANANHVWCAED